MIFPPEISLHIEVSQVCRDLISIVWIALLFLFLFLLNTEKSNPVAWGGGSEVW